MKLQERNVKTTYRNILLIAICVLAGLLFWDISARAETMKIGTVHGIDAGSNLNFRSEPDTSKNNIVAKLQNGDKGTIIGERTVSGYKWYQMNVNGTIGWAREDFINITMVDISSDADFEEYLTAQGFPESYKSQLRVLHSQYPNWQFEAQHTNLTWDEVIAAENRLGVSLVSKNSISSWKSIQTGAYDWTTGTWIGLDGGSWTAASKELIEHYVDPRNFLDDQYIFQFLKQSYDSNLNYRPALTSLFSRSQFWSSSFVEGGKSKTYVDAVIEAGEKSAVSPFTIASTVIVEQGWNPSSGLISGASGYYNFFNVGAFEGNGMQPVERGIWYAKQTDASELRPWNTRTKALTGGAIIFGEKYIKIGQDTLYLKKFDVVPHGGLYNHQYMTNIQAAASEGKVLSEAFWDEGARDFTRTANLKFKIPVYKNMPSTACPRPTGTGSPNNMLKTLSVAGQSLTPTFNMYETSYSMIVSNSVSSVNISASAYDSAAKITGTGTTNLSVGNNKVDVVVTAPSGNVRTYTINIVRQEAPSTPSTPSDTPTPTVTSSKYKMDSSSKIVTGVQPSTSASEFLKGISVSNGSVKVVKLDGSNQTGTVGTGNKVNIYDNNNQLKSTYEVIIYGDTDGDGTVYTLDYMRIRKSILGTLTLTGAYKKAADSSRDGQVGALDYMQVKKQILGTYTIPQ